MHRLLPLPCLVAILAAAATVGAPDSLLVADAPAGPLRPAPDIHGDGAMPGLDGRTDVVRARLVSFDDSAFVTPRDGPTTVSLNLFDDVTLDVVLEREEAGLNVDRVLVGHVDGAEHSYVVFVETDGRVWADIWTLDAGEFEIRHAGADVHLVAQVARERVADRFGGQFCAVDCDAMIVSSEPVGEDLTEAGDRDSGDLIDVLVLYTPAARQGAGGAANMTNALNGWIATANAYYTNSQMAQRVRLVHAAETAYVESPNIETDLARFSGAGDPHMPEVHDLRNFYGADICELVADASGCGYAWCMSNPSPQFASQAFGVTNYFCGASTFAHEMGHNMGCAHNHANVDCAGSYCYSHGHKTSPSGFYTIMSYPPGTQIPYFSNPDITVQGFAIGVAEVPGCANGTAADNSRSMDTNRTIVANFRQATIDNPAPSAFDLILPPSGATGVDVPPVLQWEPAEFAMQYEVTLSDEPDMSPVLWSIAGLNTTATLVPAGVLDFCTTYYWTVVATGFGGSTPSTPAPASFTTALVGDINGNGMVDFPDLNFLLFQYSDTGPNDADLDGDFDVDFADLNLLLSNYNQAC